jgi:thiosulfate reductase / polysulfide reductase chain A
MEIKVTRRRVLELGGVVGATFFMAPAFEHFTSWAAATSAEGATSYVRSFCEMCTSRCPIEAKIVDKSVAFISGNPDWKPTGGRVCARGGAGFSQMYDPQRLKKPLIRTGERGEGKWREATWEEAFDLIASRMKELKEKYGPESMAFACRKGPHMPFLYNLAKAYGSPNTFNHESTCPLARTVALEATFGTADLGIDYGNVRYLITLGRNYFEGIHVAQARGVMSALQKGAKLVSVDPRYSITSAKAHEWLRVKPGTDLAFVLALNNVLIRENLYDKEFVDNYTEGFSALAEHIQQYTPEWAEKECDISASDTIRIAQELAAARPKAVVDWGWRTQSTPEEFELRRAIVIANMLLGNLEVPGGTFFQKNAKFLNTMVGTDIVPTLKWPKMPPFPEPARPRIDGAKVQGHPNIMVPPVDGVVQMIPEAILTGEPYSIHGWFVYRYNPANTMPDTKRVVEALKKLDFLAVCDIYMSDTAWHADVVLPEATYLERDEGFMDYSGGAPFYTLRQQAAQPLNDALPYWQIMQGIAQRLNLGDYYNWKTIDEFRLAQLDGNEALLKKAKEQGFLGFLQKPLFLRNAQSVADFAKAFPAAQTLVDSKGLIDKPLTNLHTKTKRIELFSHEAEELFGRGLPVYKPVNLKEAEENYFIQGKVAIHTNGHTHNVPWLNDLMPTDGLWIHPETAAKLGVKNGDLIDLVSDIGTEQGKVVMTKGIRPDTVFTYFGFGRISPDLKRAYKIGVNCNHMLKNSVAPVAGVTLQTRGVSIKRV